MKLYFCLAYSPFLFGIGFFWYRTRYPALNQMIVSGMYDKRWLMIQGLLLVGMLLVPALLIGLFFRVSRLRHGCMLWINHRQLLGRMILHNRYFITEKQTVKGTGQTKTKERMTYFPKIYYQRKKGFLYVRFPLDLSAFQQRFLTKGKELEEALKLDLVEAVREEGFICYKFLYDVKLNRINFEDVCVKEGHFIRLMKNLWWDIDGSPHGLVVGGTGGGKSFLLFSLIKAFLQLGTVDICDPKQSDLKQLRSLPVFNGHVFFGIGIAKRLDYAEKLMRERFNYMEGQGKQTLGNYREYGLKPYFLVIDEWAAYYDSIEKDLKLLRKVLSSLTQVTLLGRQSGVFIILGMQRPDQKYFEGGIRDNLGLRVTVGKLSPTGYDMIYAGATNEKAYYNTNEKGRGYHDVGTSQVGEFYAPFIDTTRINIFEYFSQFPMQESPLQVEKVYEADKVEEGEENEREQMKRNE
ncbi:cell division protein FtsK [Enterococcus faecalis]|nr:cell division protein FtsK [Enterococcus faecalis]MBO6453359.1 cell division protein FtsK [Enterococcus faecalis]